MMGYYDEDLSEATAYYDEVLSEAIYDAEMDSEIDLELKEFPEINCIWWQGEFCFQIEMVKVENLSENKK